MDKNGQAEDIALSKEARMLIAIAMEALQGGRAIRRDLLEIMGRHMSVSGDEMKAVLWSIGRVHARYIQEEYAS